MSALSSHLSPSMFGESLGNGRWSGAYGGKVGEVFWWHPEGRMVCLAVQPVTLQ